MTTAKAIVHVGNAVDVLRSFDDDSVHCIVTSPPYWALRDYNVEGQIGLEETPQEFVQALVSVFEEARRVLRKDGTCWINIGDSYATPGSGVRNPNRWPKQHRHEHVKLHKKRITGLPFKSLIGIPWMLAFALRDSGWMLRSEVVWHKTRAMPESVGDRPARSHEHVFLFTKTGKYVYDADAVRTPLSPKTRTVHGTTRTAPTDDDRLGQVFANNLARDVPTRKPKLVSNGDEAGANLRSVWSIAPEQRSEKHFAIMPMKLVEPCILAGCPKGGVVLDPFTGTGTVGLVALRHDRRFVGIELNPLYAKMAHRRILMDAPMFNTCDVVPFGTARSA